MEFIAVDITLANMATLGEPRTGVQYPMIIEDDSIAARQQELDTGTLVVETAEKFPQGAINRNDLITWHGERRHGAFIDVHADYFTMFVQFDRGPIRSESNVVRAVSEETPVRQRNPR